MVWRPHRDVVAAFMLLCAGAAIAAAVLEHLVQKTRCCGLFATHYHQLAAEHQSDPQVAIMHMACAVSDELEQPQQADCTDDGSKPQQVAEVTFLYQLTQGGCNQRVLFREQSDCIAEQMV